MTQESPKRLLLTRPRGFCAGVVRAVDAAHLALQQFGTPIYMRHAIVHNAHVVGELEAAGAVFVEDLSEVPNGSRVFFSAHGVAPAIRDQAREQGLKVVDATCPLVSKVHQQAVRMSRAGYTIVLIGHRDHVEVEGTRGEASASTVVVSSVAEVDQLWVPDPSRVCYLTQTTLSLDDVRDIVSALERRFPMIRPPPSQDICYATENRQTAVRAVARRSDMVLVVGSHTSSNSRSLAATARSEGVPSALVTDVAAVPWRRVDPVRTLGLTSGASTPEWVVQEFVTELGIRGFRDVEEVEVLREDVTFRLPKGVAGGYATE